MSIEHSDIEAIAGLARLSLKEDEVDGYLKDLKNILKLVEEMNAVDTDVLEPLAHPLEVPARLRQDKVTESDQRDINLASAPEAENGLYLVPRVIE